MLDIIKKRRIEARKRRVEAQWKVLVEGLKRAESTGYKSITIGGSDMNIHKLYKENVEKLIREGAYIEVKDDLHTRISWKTKDYKCVYTYNYPVLYGIVLEVNEKTGQIEETKLSAPEYLRDILHWPERK